MDYGFSEKRKNKNDKRAKARFNKYKQGGKYRSTEVTQTEHVSSTGKKN